MGMERSDRRHQPIAAAQSGLTVYVTGLLPQRLPDTLLSSRAAMEVPTLY